MSSKFFTNQGTNTLENRLKDILTHYDIKNLEFLIGYFRISGFKKIAKLLDNVDKVRILVGINIDKLTHDAQARGKKFNLFDYEKFNKLIYTLINFLSILFICETLLLIFYKFYLHIAVIFN